MPLSSSSRARSSVRSDVVVETLQSGWILQIETTLPAIARQQVIAERHWFVAEHQRLAIDYRGRPVIRNVPDGARIRTFQEIERRLSFRGREIETRLADLGSEHGAQRVPRFLGRHEAISGPHIAAAVESCVHVHPRQAELPVIVDVGAKNVPAETLALELWRQHQGAVLRDPGLA